MVEHEDVAGIGQSRGTMSHPQVKGAGIEPGECQQETVTGGWCDGPIEIALVEGVGHGRDGLHATGRDTPPDNRQQAHTPFILGKDFDGHLGGIGGQRLLEERGEVSWKLGHGVRLVFAWAGRGRFGLARSVPRTKASTPAYDKCT
jgi:hypothetical protein